jgi:hypothetical protein
MWPCWKPLTGAVVKASFQRASRFVWILPPADQQPCHSQGSQRPSKIVGASREHLEGVCITQEYKSSCHRANLILTALLLTRTSPLHGGRLCRYGDLCTSKTQHIFESANLKIIVGQQTNRNFSSTSKLNILNTPHLLTHNRHHGYQAVLCDFRRDGAGIRG